MTINIDDLLKKADKQLGKSSRQKKRKPKVSGNGYTYVYDELGNPVLKHRSLMEKKLKRKLLPHEAVYFKDGDRTNIKIDNLQLGIKPGKHEEIKCPHCENNIFET